MKILVIGLDAATMDLIEPWAGGGHLPTLARLMNEGSSSRLISTPNMHSASAWTSILTGLNPGRHGLFVFSDRDFATGKQIFFKGGDRSGELISSHLRRHGFTAGFLNVPMTYPAQCEHGSFMVSGLDAPSLNDRAFCPAELRPELSKRFPDYHFTPPGLGDLMRRGRLDDATDSWMKLIETQTRVAEYLIDSRPTDFFMTVYTASDWGGHNLWKRGEDSGAENPDARLLEIYHALDLAIVRLLRNAGSETQVYIISDHGMGPHTGASYHLAAWLVERGYMARSGSQTRDSILSSSRKAFLSLLPVSVREQVRARIGEDRIERLRAAEKDSFYSSIDWEHTVAYSEPGRHVININLQGRNANGTIPRSDYDATCARIIEALGQWTDARGEKVVDRVVRRENVYSGPFTESASDLYIYWNPAARVGEPPDEVRARGFWWSGDHRPEGILICAGPGIRSSSKIDAPSVYDLAPTISYGAVLPVPGGLDGDVIRDLFTDEFLSAHPFRTDSSSARDDAAQSTLSVEEEEMVEEKLRGLGYL